MKALAAQARAEVSLTLRRSESLLLAIVIPVTALSVFSSVKFIDFGPGIQPVAFLTPGILALAIMSTAMVNLSIATGFERFYGVLKRLGATPLGRPRLIAAKTAAVVAVELIQVVVIVAVGFALGWHPGCSVTGWLSASGAGLLATVAFSALGMLMAGVLSAYLVLGLANGLWFVMLLGSGMLFPVDRLPAGLRTASEALPSTALSEILHRSLSVHQAAAGLRSWIVLVVWALGASLVAAGTFRWE